VAGGFGDQALQQGGEDTSVPPDPKRPQTVGQGPNSPGISRHCALVLNRQITPSN
jgi:hypothetical protein